MTVPSLTSNQYQLATVTCTVQNYLDDIIAPKAEKSPRPGKAVQVKPDGSAELTYEVRMWNDSPDKRAIANNPKDVFQLPSNVTPIGDATVDIKSKSDATTITDAVETIPRIALENNASVNLADRIEMPKQGDEIVFRISFPIKVDAVTAEEWQVLGECVAKEGGGFTGGVLNLVEVSGDTDKSDDQACIPLIKPTPAQILFNKVHASDKTTSIPGAEFTIYGSKEDGAPDYAKEVQKISGDGQPVESQLFPGKYWLVETKAPADYQLIADPVQFEVIGTQTGWAAQLIEGGASLVNFTPTPDVSGTQIVIQVADVQTGTLPRTGGSGLTIPIAIASILIAAGYLYTRRKPEPVKS